MSSEVYADFYDADGRIFIIEDSPHDGEPLVLIAIADGDGMARLTKEQARRVRDALGKWLAES